MEADRADGWTNSAVALAGLSASARGAAQSLCVGNKRPLFAYGDEICWLVVEFAELDGPAPDSGHGGGLQHLHATRLAEIRW